MSKYHRLSWDEESKQKEREGINKRKPWLKSTGPKTKKGKEKSKINALKNDYILNSLIQELNELLKKQKEIKSTIKNVKCNLL